jgi:signal transduction histidine kinase/PAS domain-containing protein
VTVEVEARFDPDLLGLGQQDQGSLLRDMAAGRSLSFMLERLVRAIELRAPGLIASVLLVESGRLRLGAAPNLPDGYNRAADHHPIGEGYGSCGTAAHRRQLVVVENIDQDPLWKNYRDIAHRYRLSACWSVPIFGSSDEVVGTFALYHHEPRRPRGEELALIGHYAGLAAFVIEHHRTRSALAERELQLRVLVEDLEGMAWEAEGEQRRFTFVSRGAEQRLGLPAQRWYSEPGLWEARLHPEDREATLRRHRQAAQELSEGEFSYRLLGDKDRVFWVRDVVHLRAESGAGPRLRGTMVNITSQREAEQEREDLLRRQQVPEVVERKRAEDSLRLLADAGAQLGSLLEAEATARSVAALATRELADWCLIVTLADGESLRCTAFAHRDPARAPLGADLERLLPQPGGVPFGVAAVLARGEPALLPDIPADAYEPGAARPELMRLARALGAESAMAVPLLARHRDPAGASATRPLLGAMLLVSAEPGRRYGERDLLVGEELGHRAALALANARLYQEAQAAIRHREEFLSIAAHELRTPLATLQLTTQSILLVLDRPPLDLDFLRTRAQAGERQAIRLSRLINDLLDVSSIKAGQMRIHREKMDLVAAVQAALSRLQHELSRKGVDVAVHATEPVLGRWDPDRIEQVIINLLNNAVKYGERRPVRITVRDAGKDGVLQVEDQGIGIGTEMRGRLFHAFERGMPAAHSGGLGLGLYITAQIVRAHGGTISVRSSPGQGSTFTVELPKKPQPERPDEHHPHHR